MSGAENKSEEMRDGLGNGLLLRCARSEDADALADFNAVQHGDAFTGQPREGIRRWIRLMVSGGFPAVRADDFLVVVETSTGRVVSSVCFIPRTWTYEGISFGVGRAHWKHCLR